MIDRLYHPVSLTATKPTWEEEKQPEKVQIV